MKLISNPDGTISLSRLLFVSTWLVVMAKYILADVVLGPFDGTAAAMLLTSCGGAYVFRAHQQGKNPADPKAKP
ncbi:hypothetical protein [Mariprofundus ferrooxydans]|uniref:Uncharacterized protein n=1 Tax=Mariprofundus ferrooxydans PV-1 TaxID=314345 RepID=Q0EWC7_9PROT|nr:hypothetical protein [Mariprofundus ferrooxydans]EAU53544.1 hypothetical protein SPV1_02863 [Mariprofundus ferrooxydans PV-1]KON47007.1 hypothetical protein AL013_10470 [Mariprofundus ferrooxydans]